MLAPTQTPDFLKVVNKMEELIKGISFSEITKELDENKVNLMLKESWVLINVGNQSQVQNVREGNEVKKAIGQIPYYVLGKPKKS